MIIVTLKSRYEYRSSYAFPTILVLTGTLKPHSNGPIQKYGDWYTALVVDGWVVTFGAARKGLGGTAAAPPSPFLAVPNLTTHSSTASVLISYYSMWYYNWACTIMG